jgi:hypothetical protein
VPLPQDNPHLKLEQDAIERATQVIEQATSWRDATEERAFSLLYGF